VRHLDAFATIASDNDDTRASGTPGYDASVAYVSNQLEQMGYDVTVQPVDFTFFRETAPVELSVGDQAWSGIEWLHAMVYSAGGDVSGPVQTVGIGAQGQPTETGGCDPSDWNDFTEGAIAVMWSGPCFRRDALFLAQDAGAAAMITMYNTWGANQTRQPTMFDPTGIEIPSIAVGQEPALALLDAEGQTAELSVEVEMLPSTASNVIAELPGGDEIVMAGGHLDSVLDGPGLNDNASGSATLLAIAEAMTAQARAATVRFGFWAIEELGIHGSTHYVENLGEAERQRFAGYLNLDMVGSVNAGHFVYQDEGASPASAAISDLIMTALADLGAPALGIPSGGSDHEAFNSFGIPTGGVFSGIAPLSEEEAALFGGEAGVYADPCYHLICDDRTNVDSTSAQLFGQAVAEVMLELAQ
jgi:Zn-dependent M28 family amino/carboxypeptidase